MVWLRRHGTYDDGRGKDEVAGEDVLAGRDHGGGAHQQECRVEHEVDDFVVQTEAGRLWCVLKQVADNEGYGIVKNCQTRDVDDGDWVSHSPLQRVKVNHAVQLKMMNMKVVHKPM